MYRICKRLRNSRIITHSKKVENKKKLEAENIIKFFTILGEQKFTEKKFVAVNLKRIPLIEPGSVDLCFILDSLMDMKSQIGSLMDFKKQVSELKETVKSLSKQPDVHGHAPKNTQRFTNQPAWSGKMQKQTVTNGCFSTASTQQLGTGTSGMINNVNLQVNLPKALPQSNILQGKRFFNHKPVVVGSKRVDNSTFKASSRPHEFHLHLGNLELDTSADEITKYVECNNVPVGILSCDIVQSTRWKEPRSLSAHVVVNLLHKEAALNPEN